VIGPAQRGLMMAGLSGLVNLMSLPTLVLAVIHVINKMILVSMALRSERVRLRVRTF